MAKILKDYPEISLKSENLDKPLNFEKVFGRKGTVHVEIGSGRGTFLVNQAGAQPDINFLGIEWANKYYCYAVDRIGRWGLTNVRLIRTDAASFLADYVPPAAVDCFHIYFPDPWPKKRHHKRRLISNANIELFIRSLVNGGIIQIATDHEDYFEQIKEVITQNKDKLEVIDFTPPANAKDGEWTGTNYERKYIKQNRPVFTLAVKKIITT